MEKTIRIQKITGGFAGSTIYNLNIIIHLPSYSHSEQQSLDDAQAILDKLFPGENIDVNSIFIHGENTL